MSVKVNIKTDNAAFQDGAFFPEVARILRDLANFIEDGTSGNTTKVLRDINGNTVGSASIRWTR